jgi:carboxypeptidase C (cathepsin A)
MVGRFIRFLIISAIVFVRVGDAAANDDSGKKSEDKGKKDEAVQEEPKKEPKEEISETSHSVIVNGEKIKYTAIAGTILLKDQKEKPKATVFYTAYTRDGARDFSVRPVTFSFNGGPGSSSVWLHLGCLGPRRVQMGEGNSLIQPPYKLINNSYSILDVTDLVFIDPVSTGYSRAVKGEDPKQFHGVTEDLRSVGDFIRLYTTRHKRWSSPKFLIGESYGSTRAAALAAHLQDQYGMYLNGVMLISSVLDFQTIRFDTGNDLPYILFLPSYTATAWYHKKLPADLQKNLRETLDEVETFALGEYASALLKGSALSVEEINRVSGKLARYTGLTVEYVGQTDLRINIHRFIKELLRDKRRTIGRFDSRYIGIDKDAAGESNEYDPSYAAFYGPSTSTLNDYIRTELEFESDLPYEILTSRVHPWNYGQFKNRYVNVAENLRQALTKNPFLKVFVASGYYDLATPYLAAIYTFNHLGVDSSLQKNISMDYYDAGHMMYYHEPSLIQLKKGLSRFIQASTPR